MDDEAGSAGQWVPVGEFDSLPEAHEYAVVVLAMGLDCWIRQPPDGRGFQIMTEPAHTQAIRDEFLAYASEQVVDAAPVATPGFGAGLEIALAWVIALFVVHYLQMQDAGLSRRFCNSSAGLFERGEWWRPLTALFLHSDFPHLLGNVLFGLLFITLAALSVGPWRAWSLTLISGVVGNAGTAWIHHPGLFRSLGASTATFGALGILAGYGAFAAWRARSYRKLGGLFVPLGAGVLLLGWLGSGGPQTDVMGHLLGFLAGIVSGLAAAKLQVARA